MKDRTTFLLLKESDHRNFRWFLALMWLIAIAGITFIVTTQSNLISGPESNKQPIPSSSLSASNQLQPSSPKVTSQGVAAIENGVYTYVCHDLKIAPSRMQFKCQDGEDFIDEITWKVWKATGATGVGVLNQSDCPFGCKSPKYSKYPVTVKLSSPIQDGGKVYFGRFDYLYVDASGREFPGVWDPTAVHDGRVISENG